MATKRKRKQFVFPVVAVERGYGSSIARVYRSMKSAEKYAAGLVRESAPTEGPLAFNIVKSWGEIDRVWIEKREVF